MIKIFPEMVTALPKAHIPLPGATAYISQAENHQILFMEFSQDLEIQEHSHASQWGVVLEGKIDLIIDGKKHSFLKGDRYYIPAGAKHSAKIYAGYADMTYFDEKDRYKVME